MPRTESDILKKAPFKVTLGDREYDIKIVPIGRAMEWRTRFNELMSPIILSFQQTAGPETLKDGFAKSVLQFPERIVTLLREYAPYLPWEELLGADENKAATEEQLALAFSRLMEIAYPFLTQLGTITSALRASASQQ